MRVALVCLLALVVVASPAAQAFLCACDPVAAAPDSRCCCGGADSCGCCPEPGDPVSVADQGCVCKQHPPRDAGVTGLDLPAPNATALLDVAPTVRLRTPAAAPLRRDPHPEVVLPLLV